MQHSRVQWQTPRTMIIIHYYYDDQDNLKVELHDYEEEEDVLSSNETFSGKLIRQEQRSTYNGFDSMSQYPHPSIPPDPWRKNSKGHCVFAQ